MPRQPYRQLAGDADPFCICAAFHHSGLQVHHIYLSWRSNHSLGSPLLIFLDHSCNDVTRPDLHQVAEKLAAGGGDARQRGSLSRVAAFGFLPLLFAALCFLTTSLKLKVLSPLLLAD